MSQRSLFANYLALHLQEIEDFVLARTPTPVMQTNQTPDLDRYLYGPVARFVASGGKRIRPALCLLGAEAVGANYDVAMPLAAAVELFQSAALIHDDIADQSELRRGKPCMHVSQGVGIAINAGDAALVAVTSGIAREESYSFQMRLRLLDELCTMQERTLEGQALDLGWARDNRWDISVEDYLMMARHKTAFYSAAMPLAMGALCAGGSPVQIEGLRTFGMRCGLAFQIQDDLLNLVGNADAQGKDFRSDITEGKRTLVMVWTLAHAAENERDELVHILSSHTSDKDKLSRAVAIAQQTGGIEHARSYAQMLTTNAKDALAELDIANDTRNVLVSMADYFVERRN